MRVVLAAVFSGLLMSSALANFYTLQEWSALNPSLRENYIAGAFDSLITVGTGEDSDTVAVHYRNCVKGAHMSLSQLSDNVLRFAKSKPEVQAGPVQTALVRYLISACGEPQPQH
jgi:hypothetical protein